VLSAIKKILLSNTLLTVVDLIFRKTLEHGKHVLVDFPLSLSAQSGKELFNLAESKGNT